MMKWITALLIAAAICQIEAKQFLRCELVKELIKLNFERSYLPIWDCLIESVSQRNTSKVITQPNKSVSYGLFQINSKDWCRSERKGGICNMKCEDFLNTDLADDARCARQIQAKEGFKHWPGWQSRCYMKTLPDLNVLCNFGTSI